MKIKVLFFIVLLLLLINICENRNNIILGGKKLYITTEIIKKTVDKLQLKYKIYNHNTIEIYHKNKVINFIKYRNNINKNKIKMTYNKPNVNNLLKKNNVKISNFKIFKHPQTMSDIDFIVSNHKKNYPLVVKPTDGTGGVGVHVNILNNIELKNILVKYFYNKKILNSSNTTLMIEDLLEGNDYRILCYKNNIIDIVQRIKPYIIGNNKNTIKELIDLKNIENKRKGIYSIKYKKKILDEQNLCLNSILKNKQYVIVNNVSNFHQGGILKRINIKNVHIDNINMFKKVNKILNLNLCGIDFMINDISKSYKIQNTSGINEVNTNPNFDIHYYCNNTTSQLEKFFHLYFDI